MTPVMLRHFWSSIEATQTNVLLTLDDPSLVQWLMKQFKQERALNRDEVHILSDYISSKILLIRDLAHQRLITES